MIAATSGELDRLLPPGADLERALKMGAVNRVKVQGRWIYTTPDATIDDALETAQEALRTTLTEWLLNPARYLAGQASRLTGDPGLGTTVMTILTHELCALGALEGLALLTRAYQPYLAFYLPDDRPEIQRQVEAMRAGLATHGEVRWKELPSPLRVVPRKAWRMTVIAHGEWLGLGWQPDRGVLVSW